MQLVEQWLALKRGEAVAIADARLAHDKTELDHWGLPMMPALELVGLNLLYFWDETTVREEARKAYQRQNLTGPERSPAEVEALVEKHVRFEHRSQILYMAQRATRKISKSPAERTPAEAAFATYIAEVVRRKRVEDAMAELRAAETALNAVKTAGGLTQLFIINESPQAKRVAEAQNKLAILATQTLDFSQVDYSEIPTALDAIVTK